MRNALRPLLLTLAFAAPAGAWAQDGVGEPDRREDAGAQVRQVERDGGRVLQAEPMQRGGREVYRLKVLTPEGRVRVLHDPRGREPHTDRLDSARQSPMLRDRARVREAEARRALPPPPRERPAPPPRSEGGGEPLRP